MKREPVLRSSTFIIAALVAACASPPATDTTHAASAASAHKLGETVGMRAPESVRYDAELDVYYVSNINGNPSQKDNNGFIVRVRADNTTATSILVEGGQNGITLNAPKGMALHGDTLFVADIDVLRMFDRTSGKSLGSMDLASMEAVFLNDVAMGPDGVYITDTGIRFDETGTMTHPGTNMIFRVAGKKANVVVSGDSLMNPNGLTWDAAGKRWLLAPFGGPNIQSLTPGKWYPATVATGPGGYDGIEVLPSGTILVSSWADSTIYQIPLGGSTLLPLVKNVSGPADIGVDTRRNVAAIPRFQDGKIEYYQIP